MLGRRHAQYSLGELLSGSGGHAYSGSCSVACMGEQVEWFSGTCMHSGSRVHERRVVQGTQYNMHRQYVVEEGRHTTDSLVLSAFRARLLRIPGQRSGRAVIVEGRRCV